MIFLTSDTHFHHKNVIDFTDRPYSTLEEMHEGMIKNWNDTVKKTDDVYVLGDFSFGKKDEWAEILDRLKGNIILVSGNHDKTNTIKKMVDANLISENHPLGLILKQKSSYLGPEGNMKERTYYLHLTHYPMLIGNRPRMYSIHGHIHENDCDAINLINIGVDSPLAKSLGKPFGAPISMDELITHIDELEPLLEKAYNEKYHKIKTEGA